MEFRNANDANNAIAAMHMHPFDARHTFKVNRFSDIERFSSWDERYEEPPDEEYQPKASGTRTVYTDLLTMT
jgi:translation initiation factor 3 subunit B